MDSPRRNKSVSLQRKARLRSASRHHGHADAGRTDRQRNEPTERRSRSHSRSSLCSRSPPLNRRHREQTVSSANSLFLNPDGPEEDRKMDHVMRLLTEVAQAQNLSKTSQSSLSELCKQLQIKPYKERATQAMIAAGVTPPDGNRPHTLPALCNPKQTSEVRGIAFPLEGNDYIQSSRLLALHGRT